MENNKFIKNKTLLILVIAFLISRLIILSTSPYLFDYEESRSGLIAKELLTGPKLPLFEYQSLLGPHQGSIIIEGILIVPYFLLFGEYGTSLKLLWLSFYLISFIVLFLSLQKFFNKKVAIITALLFIFSPQFFTIKSLTESGSHMGQILLGGSIIYLFYNIFFNNKRKFKNFALFGAVCGFALHLEFSPLVIIFVSMLFWFIFDKKFFLKKRFFIFLVFFLIGFSPSLYFNFTYDFIGYNGLIPSKFFQSSQTDNFLLASASKFSNLATTDLPDSFNSIDSNFRNGDYFEYTLYLKFLNYGYYLIFIISYIYLFYLNRIHILNFFRGLIPSNKFNIPPTKIGKELFVLVYFVIFFIIYSVSRYNLGPLGWVEGYHYIFPIYPFIFVIISLSIVKFLSKKNEIFRYSGYLVFIIAILIGILGNINLVEFNNWNWGNNSLYKPYNYELFAEWYGHFCNLRNLNCKNECNKLNDEHIPYCYRSIGRYTASKLRFNYNKKIKECEELGDKKNYCYLGIGFGTRENLNIDLSVLKCNKLDIENRVYCYQGLGFGLAEDLIRRGIHEIPSTGIKECNLLNKEHQQYCYKGLSEGVGLAYRHLPASGLKECIKLPKGYQSYCLGSPYLAYEK